MADIDTRLANRILVGLALGAVAGSVVLAVGSYVPALLDGAQWFATTVCDPLGQVFLRMLFFVVIPLVFASLANGVVQLGELSHLGPLAGRTFTLFFLNMTIAATLGLLMMNILQPLQPVLRAVFLMPHAHRRLSLHNSYTMAPPAGHC